MVMRALSGQSASLAVGQPWRIELLEQCWTWNYGTVAPVVTVTLPDGVTTALATIEASEAYYGRWTATYTPLAPGRFTARAVASNGDVVDALAVVTAAVVALPDRAALNTYLGGTGNHAWTDSELDEALAAETAAQMRMCSVPAAYPADLREALLRRAARNLDMRRQLTAEPRSEGDFDLPATLPVAADADVRRLERPWRRLPQG